MKRKTFAPLDFEGSIVVWLSLIFISFFRLFNPYTYIELYYHSHNQDIPEYYCDIWVIFLLLIQILCFYANISQPLILFISIYGLYNIVLSAATDLIENPIINKIRYEEYFIEISNPVRWLLLTMINFIQIVLCFGLIYLIYGQQFKPPIGDPITAIYQSLLTFTTLGYGEITPICSNGKKIVISELSYFLGFLVLKLPVVLSAFFVDFKGRKGN